MVLCAFLQCHSWSSWNVEMLVFEVEGKSGVPGERSLGARERTNKKPNPHMSSSPVPEPGPHWWEASALTIAPSLASLTRGGHSQR